MTNESLDIRVAIGEANLDELKEYEALVAKEIKKRRSAIRKSQFDSFARICEQFLKDLSEEDRAECVELSAHLCEDCYARHSHYEPIECTLNALIEYFKKA